MECYHPENNEWTILPSMKTGRSGAGVAALNQYVFVVGGFDGRAQLSDVERYDTEQQIWESVAKIQIARSALSLTVLDGKLYAMGGFDGQSFTSVSEIYDPAIDRWEEGTPLTSGRSGHAAAVIYQPSCASVYMDCFGDPIDKNKHQPDDDENARYGPSTSRNTTLPSSSMNTLHFFSGNRCNHCDNNSQQSDVPDSDLDRMTYSENSVNFELNKSHDHLRNNCNEDSFLCSRTSSVNSELPKSSKIDVAMRRCTVETEFICNSEQYRRKEMESDFSDEDTEVFDSDSNSNSRDSLTSIKIANDRQSKYKPQKEHHCSLSKLTRTFRQNCDDFLEGTPPSTTSFLKDKPFVKNLEKNDKTDSIRINPNERKCNLLRKYYKHKLKP